MPTKTSEPLDIFRLSSSSAPKCDIVFVHGLMGTPEDTWNLDDQYWPGWLSAYGDIWIVRYPASLLLWSSHGASMAIPERAKSLIDLLVNAKIGQTRPLIFITHSLGGLLVKAILRAASDYGGADWKKLLHNTRGVVFLATPHRGSLIASISSLGKIFGISINATQLAANDPYLLDLSSWYSKNAPSRGVKTLAYYEKLPTKGLIVVDASSSDPGVTDCSAIPADYNHVDICKFSTIHHPIYGGILNFVESIVGTSEVVPDMEKEDANNTLEYSIDTVFGMHRGDTHHYVERAGVDDAFIMHLIGDRHLCIYGSSKQGKTALRKKHISESQCLVVVCDRSWTSVDVFVALLKAAGCDVQRDTSAPSTCKIRLPNQRAVLVDLNHVRDFLVVMHAIFSGKYLIIEEFHYLPEESQRDIAFKLKALHELSKHYIFIVVGVWLENNRLVHLNRDLVGRVSPINADIWTDDDLRRVITEGEQKLNIKFPTGFAAKLVEKSCGSVYLVREACRRACEIGGINNRLDVAKQIDQTINVRTLLRAIAGDGIDYQGQLLSMFTLDKSEMYDLENEENLSE
jgi:pimeloyl-ACP methyl ester carboxylesterase